MTWKYRSGGNWSVPTPKIRKGGQWVSIGTGGTGEDIVDSPSGWVNTDYLLCGDPPTRSTTVYTSNYSGLQDALDSIGEDTRLVIDDGPYSGNYDLPHTSHITLDGNGTTLDRADTNDQLLENHRTGNEFDTNTDPGGDGTYSAGQGSIDVADASIFSAGDIIRIYDSTQVLKPDMLANSGANEGQGSFHVVTAIDDNILTLDEDLFLDWDNPNGNLRVDRVNWGAEDIRITNCTFEGNDPGRDGSRVIMVRRRKGVWMDNCTVQNGTDGFWISASYQLRLDNCVFDNLGLTDGGRYYPVDITDGTHHSLVTNCESYDSQRYGFKSGSGGRWWPCRNGRFENCYVENSYQRAYDQHPGSMYWEYLDCDAQDASFGRPRSRGWYAEGGGYDNPGQLGYYARQGAEDVVVTQQHYTGHNSNHVYQHYDAHGIDMEYHEFRELWAEADDNLNSFFRFRTDTSTTLNELVVENVALNDTWLTESNFDDHIQYAGDFSVNTITVINDNGGRTPNEYFAAEYGW